MNHNAPRLALALVAFGPFALAACELLKKDYAPDAAATAAADAAAATAVPAAATTTAAPADTATAAPLGATAKPASPGAPATPTAAADGGKPTDAGATGDGGKAIPTPTLTIPTAIPGFDAGAFKPPPGFPSALPTWPPPPPAKK